MFGMAARTKVFAEWIRDKIILLPSSCVDPQGFCP